MGGGSSIGMSGRADRRDSSEAPDGAGLGRALSGLRQRSGMTNGKGATVWRTEPVEDEKLIMDPQIPNGDNVAEFATFLGTLRDTLGQRMMGQFARRIRTHETFFFWVDVEEFRTIPTPSYRYARARHIYHKYLKEGATQDIGLLDQASREVMEAALEMASTDASLVSKEMFDEVQRNCFLQMYSSTYLRFKQSDLFTTYTSAIRNTYNRVTVADFDYFEKLGEGAFGLVVHARKRSTGRHYAMKIQTKRGLLMNFRDDPSKLNHERTVFAACNHPYIIGMEYSFQTEHHAILVLGLVTTGTLQDAIDDTPHRRLPEELVVLFTAEVVLALDHLHEMGLMYRDLKPRNVLLDSDGHIKLADMGGVADFAGSVFSDRVAKKEDHIVSRQDEAKGMTDAEIRQITIMGTKGYMAPEMVKLTRAGRGHPLAGYTRAVDYWSLGVTVYKMLTGKRPFDAQRRQMPTASEYELLFQDVRYPHYISSSAKNLMQRLMDVNPEIRLGSGPQGVEILKRHPFFRGLDWVKLELQQVTAPWRPPPNPPMEVPLFESFEDMMRDFDAEDRVPPELKIEFIKSLSQKEQDLFHGWDYVSPVTLKREMGIAREMEVLDENLKVRQLLGVE